MWQPQQVFYTRQKAPVFISKQYLAALLETEAMLEYQLAHFQPAHYYKEFIARQVARSRPDAPEAAAVGPLHGDEDEAYAAAAPEVVFADGEDQGDGEEFDDVEELLESEEASALSSTRQVSCQ